MNSPVERRLSDGRESIDKVTMVQHARVIVAMADLEDENRRLRTVSDDKIDRAQAEARRMGLDCWRSRHVMVRLLHAALKEAPE